MRPPSTVVAFAVAVQLACAATADGKAQERLLSERPAIDKAPRLSRDWVCWTTDALATGSTGTVVVLRLATGQRWNLGPGFLPDIEVSDVPAAGADVQDVRVAWLRLADGGGLDVCSAHRERDEAGPDAWTVSVLASGLRYADQVRVCGDITAWSAPDGRNVLRIFAHDGRGKAVPISGEGQAFRPELVRNARGLIVAVWDAYLQTPGVLNYEIYLSVLGPDGRWSAPRNVSEAPDSLDMAPSAAAADDGTLWLAWQTNRGGARMLTWIEQLQPDGSALLPEPWPAGARRGTIFLRELHEMGEPVLRLDGAGRPWLFVPGQPADFSKPGAVFDHQLHYLVLDELGWSEPAMVTPNKLGDIALDAAQVAGEPYALRVVYQSNTGRPPDPEIAECVLRTWQVPPTPSALAPVCLKLLPSSDPPEPQSAIPVPALPVRRSTGDDDQPYRLVFADFHNHTGHSPDGIGERDHSLFTARDIVHLDALAITDHDDRYSQPITDWEFEQGRLFMALFDTPQFAALMGIEWTNDENRAAADGTGPMIGHRACFDARHCYRYTDPAMNELSELDAALRADDAIGVPHHLGRFGGTSFAGADPSVQPVTEICSQHGDCEKELWTALLRDGVRCGVTASGDEHNAWPGNFGLAGLWIDTREPDLHAALKAALRARRCFGVRRDGVWLDVRMNGEPAGSALTLPAGAATLRLDVHLHEIPVVLEQTAFNANLVRDGDVAHPVWQAPVQAGQDLDVQAEIPAPEASAIYMLRLSRGTQTSSAATILWSSPFWVDVEPRAER